MPDRRDKVEIGGHPGRPETAPAPAPDGRQGSRGNPWLRLWFECCGQYGRAYKRLDGAAYTGRCPGCGRTIKFPVGEGGTTERFFRVR